MTPQVQRGARARMLAIALLALGAGVWRGKLLWLSGRYRLSPARPSARHRPT